MNENQKKTQPEASIENTTQQQQQNELDLRSTHVLKTVYYAPVWLKIQQNQNQRE